MPDVDIDTAELTRFANGLARRRVTFLAEVSAVVSKASVNIKKDMQAEIATHKHFKRAGADIRFEMTGLSSEVFVETGRGPGHQGGLAWIAAYGTSTQPPSWDHTAALHREAPAFERFLGEVAARAFP